MSQPGSVAVTCGDKSAGRGRHRSLVAIAGADLESAAILAVERCIGAQERLVRVPDMCHFGIGPVDLEDGEILALFEVGERFEFQLETAEIKSGNLFCNRVEGRREGRRDV